MNTPLSAPRRWAFFSLLARCGSFSATARELNVTTPAVSKGWHRWKRAWVCNWSTRTTRRVSLTPEGETYLQHARRILAEIDGGAAGFAHPGHAAGLRVNATLGFGRSHIAPLISDFVRQHPLVQVQLQLSVDPPPLAADAFDVCASALAKPPDARVIARRIAPTGACCAQHRLPGAPGHPKLPSDLARHDCMGIRQERRCLWPVAADGRAPDRSGEGARRTEPLTTARSP